MVRRSGRGSERSAVIFEVEKARLLVSPQRFEKTLVEGKGGPLGHRYLPVTSSHPPSHRTTEISQMVTCNFSSFCSFVLVSVSECAVDVNAHHSHPLSQSRNEVTIIYRRGRWRGICGERGRFFKRGRQRLLLPLLRARADPGTPTQDFHLAAVIASSQDWKFIVCFTAILG